MHCCDYCTDPSVCANFAEEYFSLFIILFLSHPLSFMSFHFSARQKRRKYKKKIKRKKRKFGNSTRSFLAVYFLPLWKKKTLTRAFSRHFSRKPASQKFPFNLTIAEENATQREALVFLPVTTPSIFFFLPFSPIDLASTRDDPTNLRNIFLPWEKKKNKEYFDLTSRECVLFP